MGVPKFYRWISERYPCLSQIIQEHQIPEFDNLYLDMNGIIHPCSHPNDDDPHFRKSEEDVFEDIFHYIEVLFRIIKPKKVFFMAVDGVAPRAKMNQQRGRRFRSAKEAEDNIRKALEKDQVLPKEERFDSNCITPGTPFMVRLHEQLKFFISYKISTDPAWQGLRIYLSGHETPGEGEHKIMEFIRHEKTRPDHDPNTRHCLYGLDADLIMLGLSSHEPHFALLREEVRFGKAAKRITKPEKTSFHLLHLSLFREYLDWEFSELKDKLSFEYDLERIIDDWILMGFLVGNDFIPHLPNLHINHDALPYLYKMYIEVLPLLDGYLHCSGKLELARFEQYLTALSKFDREQFEEKFVDMKWFESKLALECGHEPPYTQENDIALDNSFAALGVSPEDSAVSVVKKREKDINPEVKKLAERFEKEVEEVENDDDTFEIEFAVFKRNYYMEKLGYEDVNKNVFTEQTAQYVKGIQWILLYYFCGVRSWSWFYPFHYAPFMSDIRNFSDITIEFDLGTPFLPFEQLLAVLPAASRQLLPKPFQNLMIMEQSPIIEYYPPNFKTDLNGKQHDWEAVVLIPFIDEGKLLDAMKPLFSRLSEEEIARNRHGPCLLYTYKPSLSFTFPSSLPGKFPDVTFCHAMCEELPKDAFTFDIKLMRKGLADGVKLDVYNPGFPTLYHIPHKAKLHKANVKVFQMHSKGESMILQILDPQQEIVPLRVAEMLLGETCYVGWPHLVEALVISVCDGIYRYTLSKDSSKNIPKEILQELLSKVQFDSWTHQVSELTEHLKERKGIELGHTSLLIEACPIRGKRFVCGVKGLVTVEKEWSPTPRTYPYQLTVKDIHCAELDDEQSIQTIEQLFPVGTVCFMLASPYYGASGEVVEIDVKQSRVRVQLYVPPEPDIASVIDQHQSLSLKYLPAHVVAKKLGISPFLLSRITGSFRVNQGSSSGGSEGRSKFDIGLNIKFSRQNKEVLGFAKRTEEGSWTFSPKAHKAIADYLHRFPQLFDSLANLPSADKVYENDLVLQDNGEGSLSDIQEWLKTVPCASLEPVKCGSISLDEPVVEAIEKAVQVKVSNVKSKTVRVRVRPHLLFKPSEHQGSILPDSETQFELFDRVVNVKLNGTVPFGLRGTLIGIHEGDDSTETMYEVVFDEVFLGGQPLRCSSNKVSLMEASSLLNISYGARCETKQSETKVTPRRPQYQGGKGSYTSPLSPSVGASPELGKKHRSKVADTKVESSEDVRLRSGFESNRSESPGETRLAFTIKDRNVRSPERNWKPSHSLKGSHGNGLSEFADMWKELKLKEVSCPDKFDADTDDDKKEIESRTSGEAESQTTHASSSCAVEGGPQALLDLLQGKGECLSGKGECLSKTPKHVGNKEQKKMQPTQGQQLTVDDLFRSQGTAAIPTVSQSAPHQPAGALPSIVLFHWCCAVGLRPPIFHYTETAQGVFAVVEISNGFKFPGVVCRDRGEAAESASSVALFQLPRIMPSFPSPVGLSPPKSFVELPQQHFQQGFFTHPAKPVLQPFVQVFPPRLPSNQNSPHELASMNELALGKSPQRLSSMNVIIQEKTESTGCQLRESIPQTAKDRSTNLNVSAAPFIPLQVARRNSAMRQNSPAKGAKSSSQKTLSNFDTTEDVSKQNENSKSNSDKGLQRHSNEELAGAQESQEVSTRCTSKLKKASGPLQKTQNSRQRLLAPSFFTKKT